MDGWTFSVEITKALAWPLVALFALLAFRAELRALLQRMRKGKVGYAEFEFEETVASLRDRVKSEAPAAATEVSPAVARQADQDPRTVILNAWLTVQDKVDAIVKKRATPEDRRDPASVSLRVLHRILRDKPDYIDMYNELKMLRNQAVNEVSFAPRPSSVVQYATLAHELATVLTPYE